MAVYGRVIRTMVPGKRPWVATLLAAIAVAASVGWGGCAGEHRDATQGGARVILTACVRAELRAHGTVGVVPPAEGYARIVEIPPLGDGTVFMHDINDDGVAVGSAQVDGAHYHAFRWTERGGTTDLGAQPGFGAQSFTTAIAPDGAISGQSDHGDGTGTLYGYRWTRQRRTRRRFVRRGARSGT